MFYRFRGQRRKAVDLDGLFSGPCFLIGGSPQLNEVKDKLASEPIMKAAMNNTGTVVRPDIWIGADRAENFSASILVDPSPMKFAVISRRDCDVKGKKWHEMPNTFFVSTKQMKPKEFFVPNRDFSWDKNVFMISLQILHRLGFDTVFTVGCSFSITKESQYCYETNLNENQVNYTQNTYNAAVRQVREILPIAEQNNFKIISCTPGSKLNDVVEFWELDRAIAHTLSVIPEHSTVDSKHPAD
jgi:hypothetical protein